MNYASIRKMDITNGEGIRVSLFVSGCQFHCKNCFNQETWDYNYGKEYTQETQNKILSLICKPHIKGLSILGGDPLWQTSDGVSSLISLCDEVHKLNKNVWLWTGFVWEEVFNSDKGYQKELLKHCDVVVDGPFIEEKKDLSLKWKGSSNQRVIDVPKTLEKGEVVLWDN